MERGSVSALKRFSPPLKKCQFLISFGNTIQCKEAGRCPRKSIRLFLGQNMNSMLADATHPKQKVYHSYQKIKTHKMTKKCNIV